MWDSKIFLLYMLVALYLSANSNLCNCNIETFQSEGNTSPTHARTHSLSVTDNDKCNQNEIDEEIEIETEKPVSMIIKFK